jgi:hypothetical protein
MRFLGAGIRARKCGRLLTEDRACRGGLFWFLSWRRRAKRGDRQAAGAAASRSSFGSIPLNRITETVFCGGPRFRAIECAHIKKGKAHARQLRASRPRSLTPNAFKAEAARLAGAQKAEQIVLEIRNSFFSTDL